MAEPTPDIEERRIGPLVARIDRLLCVGFGDCLEPAANGIELDDEGIAVFTPAADALSRDQLIAIARSCPVDAITVLDGSTQIAP